MEGYRLLAADLVVFAADWTVDATIVDGQVVYRRDATMGVRGPSSG